MSVLLQIMASAAIQAWVIMASATIQAWGIQVPKGSRVDSEKLSFQTYAHASSVEQSNPTTHVNNDDSTEQQGVTIYICCTLLHMRYTSSTVLRPEEIHVITRFQLHGVAHLTDSKVLLMADVLTLLLFMLQVPGRHVSAAGAWSDS